MLGSAVEKVKKENKFLSEDHNARNYYFCVNFVPKKKNAPQKVFFSFKVL